MAKLPSWAVELGEQYRGGTIVEFIVYGAINDKVEAEDSQGRRSFYGLRKFLGKKLFPRRDAVIYYDPSHGISFRDDETFGDFHRVVQAVDASSGTNYAKQGLPRDANRALYLIERYMTAKVDPRGGAEPKSVALVIEFADLILPAGDPSHLSPSQQSTLVTLLRWARDPVYLDANLTIVLLAENLSQLNQALVESPYIGRVEVKLPTTEERQSYLEHRYEQTPELVELSDVSIPQFAKLTGGLSRVNLNHVTSQAFANRFRISSEFVGKMKRELIEKECFGMLEFLSSKHGLETVCGHEAQKTWLMEDARLIREGRIDALPMGYLICGPVGTGKTFMATCFTHDIGIPCVKLKNFRSQWYGATEANWQKILSVLKATGPVGVVIDEADAAVGDRSSGHEVSNRVFSMLATQMGDTTFRGHILWFLLTSRPDLLPVDLKRQGRAEIHIPLFYPDNPDERRKMREVLVRKCGIELADDALDVDLGALVSHGTEEAPHVHGPDCEHEHGPRGDGEEEEPDVEQVVEAGQTHVHLHHHHHATLADSEPSVGEAVRALIEDSGLSGAEIESILIRAKRRAYLNGREVVNKSDLELEAASYIPNLSLRELELQILTATIECSDRRFLPERLLQLDRAQVTARVRALQYAMATHTDIREA